MPNFIDLTGRKFGRLTVLKRDIQTKSKRVKWICQCECGNIKSISSTHLIGGDSKSCGCYQKEKVKEANTIHGFTHTSLYNRWKEMKCRCLNPHNKRYKDYGKRGITVCLEWKKSFESFKCWAVKNGYKDGLSLDRIDNDKGYYPDNCRWTNDVTQNRNKRNVVWVKNGKSKIKLEEVSDITGIKFMTLYTRYKNLGKKDVDVKDILYNNKYKLIPSQASKKLLERRRD